VTIGGLSPEMTSPEDEYVPLAPKLSNSATSNDAFSGARHEIKTSKQQVVQRLMDFPSLFFCANTPYP
jgi:hypothetical protein